MTKIILIFESRAMPLGAPNEQVFIEAHDESGKSINVGDWSADGEHEALTIDCAALCDTAHAKNVKHLDDVTAVASDPGNALANDYMRGMANGLILAQSIFSGNDPLFIDANGNRVERSTDQFKTPDLSSVEKRNAFYNSEKYKNMTTAEKCAVQGDGFLNDCD